MTSYVVIAFFNIGCKIVKCYFPDVSFAMTLWSYSVFLSENYFVAIVNLVEGPSDKGLVAFLPLLKCPVV